jgi:hypothetical protein
MENIDHRDDDQKRKVWKAPVLEVLTIANTEYWKFDDSGDFPRNVWVNES